MKLRFEEFSFEIDETGKLVSVNFVSNGKEYPYIQDSYEFIMYSFCEKYSLLHFVHTDGGVFFRFRDNDLNTMLRDGTQFSTIFMIRGL